jgi:hypothetical protein
MGHAMRDLSAAPNALHRMILVRKFAIKGAQPLQHEGHWFGLVSAVTPKHEKVQIGKHQKVSIVDYTMRVRLACGTSMHDHEIDVSYMSDGWQFRYPRKGEQT